MSFTVFYYDEAKEDIFRNADWWARNHSVAQAKIWLNAIYDQIDSLADMPERCQFAIENDRFEIDIRQLLVGQGPRKRYRTIFTVLKIRFTSLPCSMAHKTNFFLTTCRNCSRMTVLS